ncbi:hypothetical protein GRI97_08380 [Altererythrobacter xixiisoli]|uniref:Uncharacterized protein n=1 Tax=Croceibacterium xixiisoli TaxID=1476466 RepID=A0A6I4TXE3_9SPHN|nr:hypothetical protein [Croceibacterium xixiisoli]MXO99003.1 hypothetical protein [Croceibacterium xixiisoli]
MGQEVRLRDQQCAHGGFAHIGQSVVFGQLRWYRSTFCPQCKPTEEDGDGLPPEEFRRLLLNDGGYWEVRAQAGSRPAVVIRIVKSVLGLSNAEAFAQMRQFPTVFQGTQTEAEWVQGHLAAASISASVLEMGA